jgi:molybdenum cofactor cytidylyltransferase
MSEEGTMITGIILASGFSKRMEDEKLLLDVGGVPMVERVIWAARSPLIGEGILIYRCDAIKEIGKRYSLKTVYNPHAEEGQSAAVKLGISCADPATHGFMFFVGDQPCLTQSTVNELIGIFAEKNNSVVVPLYNGRRGNPVIFPSILRETLLRLEGDCGGRTVIERMGNNIILVPIDEGNEGKDIDTKADYEKIHNFSDEKNHFA